MPKKTAQKPTIITIELHVSGSEAKRLGDVLQRMLVAVTLITQDAGIGDALKAKVTTKKPRATRN